MLLDPDGLYPLVDPFDRGMLDVGDGHQVYWEMCGNPAGAPALVLHGGPGSGYTAGHRRYFDPDRYRVVLFDQRGCGRSLPSAGEFSSDLDRNTTDYVIADIERLRTHLGVDRWVLSGSSWGTTLALAYAERHARRVAAMVLVGTSLTTPEEIDWIYRGLRRFFPADWHRFHQLAPAAQTGVEIAAAYARLLADSDLAVRTRAAAEWHRWEDATISLDPAGRPGSYSDRPPQQLLARARICTHYFSHAAWLADGQLLRDAHQLAGIPGELIHGRFDLGSTLDAAWSLAQAWPESTLTIIDNAGHSGTTATRHAKRDALDRYAHT